MDTSQPNLNYQQPAQYPHQIFVPNSNYPPQLPPQQAPPAGYQENNQQQTALYGRNQQSSMFLNRGDSFSLAIPTLRIGRGNLL